MHWFSIFPLRFQLFVCYFFAGLTKLNSDWLQGEPVRQILSATVVETSPIAVLLTSELLVWFLTWTGLAFDLLIGLLLWLRPNRLVLTLTVIFHFSNALLWPAIGLFPYFMLAGNLLFLVPTFPRPLTSLQRLFLVAFVGFQLCFPLRSFLYTTDKSWSSLRSCPLLAQYLRLLGHVCHHQGINMCLRCGGPSGRSCCCSRTRSLPAPAGAAAPDAS